MAFCGQYDCQMCDKQFHGKLQVSKAKIFSEPNIDLKTTAYAVIMIAKYFTSNCVGFGLEFVTKWSWNFILFNGYWSNID